ncbi:MAG: hypothetical protein GX994_06360 [Firmicutes bacterium]|nr:hypothetical protein [Bacillota bacterium]
MSKGLELFAHCIVTHNVILFQGLGIYILLNYTKTLAEAFKAAVMMLATMLTASTIMWAAESALPISFGMRLPVILLIALLSGLLWHKLLAPYHKSSGSYNFLPIFVNSALVGALLNTYQYDVSGVNIIGYGFFCALGYGLVLIIMAGIRQRLELANVPKPLRGIPILLISTGLLALALMGFRF